MTRAILASLFAGILAIAAIESAHFIRFLAFCPGHNAWLRRTRNPSAVILEHGFLQARTDEAIYACTTTHRFAYVIEHQDVECYCAPAQLGPSAVGAKVGGVCTLSHEHPSLNDETGGCLHARCNFHLDP